MERFSLFIYKKYSKLNHFGPNIHTYIHTDQTKTGLGDRVGAAVAYGHTTLNTAIRGSHVCGRGLVVWRELRESEERTCAAPSFS